MSIVLNLIYMSAKIFSEERSQYYKNQAKALIEQIQYVEDSDFYTKDMERKGKAQRELKQKVDSLAQAYLTELAE